MKKYLPIILISFYAIGLFAAQVVQTVDSTDNQISIPSTITVTSNQIITTNSVASVAVVGTSTNNSVVGTVVKTTTGGLIDTSFITTQKAKFQTNLTANVTFPNVGIFTNVFRYTTTLGSNAIVQVHASGMNNGVTEDQVLRICIGETEVASGASYGTTGQPVGYHGHYIETLVSNVLISIRYANFTNNGGTLSATGSNANGTISNATGMSVLEFK
jgi:hypothetical protein